MKVVVVLCLLASAVYGGVVVPATTLIRTPQFDSAVIKSDRIGGNFAYSHVEAPAYAAVSPVISHVPTPVGVSYHAHPIQVPVVAPAIFPAPAVPAYVPAAFPALPAYSPVPVKPEAPVAPAAPAEPAPISDDSESVSVEAA
ncbi:uncharacterized protein LOC142322180 [Lycorma delicatula]|uniref:uncharacterized protein LOC142322180 n=1 Tax=Lycorma delicatula TaxID=130591 RepID=UPI003F512DDC